MSKFQPGEAVRFFWKGRECTGVVEERPARVSGFVLLRSNDIGHKWATLLAVRGSLLWLPGDEPPAAAVRERERLLPDTVVEQEPTAS